MPSPLRIEGLDALLAKIETLEQMRAVSGAVLAGAGHLKTAMQVYPPQVHLTRESVYGKPFQSDRQRRFFFWALRQGKIQVPYRRGQSAGSRNMKQQWTVVQSNEGLTAEIANATSYAPMMQAQALQGRYAKAAGWQTEVQVLNREGPAVVGYVRDAIEVAVAG